jgi:hypothetical protein
VASAAGAASLLGIAITILGACTSTEPAMDGGEPSATVTPVAETPAEANLESSPKVSIPPPNPWEQKVLDAFEAMGVEQGSGGEHGYRGATISADLRGDEVLVRSRALNQPGLKYKILARTDIQSVRVAVIENRTFGLSYRFRCHRTIYEVTRLHGSRDVIPAFLEDFIPAIGCPTA